MINTLEYKNNTCKLWRIINSIVGKQIDKTSYIGYIKINSIISYNPSDIYNVFAEHFALTGKTLHQKSLTKNKLHDYVNKIPRLVQSLYLNQTTGWEVKKLIKQLPNETSSGYDNINNILLQNYLMY